MIRHELSEVSEFARRADVARLLAEGAIGVELGVAEGQFSERLLATGRFSRLYSIDMWAGDRNHDVKQYKRALRRLSPFQSISTTIRMRFDEALDIFPDNYFDFIYIDGYAHTGEEDGQTIYDWWPKLKPGGVLAGDDYSPKWKLVVEQVDRFIAEKGLEFFILNPRIIDDGYSMNPTWITKKKIR